MTAALTLILGALLNVFTLIVNLVWALLFWIAWTYFGIGQTFFPFLPAQFIAPGYWQIFGLFLCLSILKNFSPFNVSSESK